MSEERVIEGRYRIERALQVGPLASTYLAEDLEGDDKVVLKELAIHAHSMRMSTDDVFKREQLLEREGKILRHLEHEQIPRFIDTFRTEEEGRVSLWLVQEYREGRNLAETVADGWHGGVDDVVRILREVAGILGHLHSRVPPIVHRDVKPANIVIGTDDAVSLVDLGAVCTRVLSQNDGSTIIGTPGYVPLEQFAGQAVPASDIYALGMVGVFLVTHEEPLKLTTDDGTVRYRHLTSVDHPTLLDTIDRMIEPHLSKRLKSSKEVIESLDGKAARAALVKRASRARALPWLAAGSVALVLAGAATAALMLSGDDAASAEPPAEELSFNPYAIGMVPETADEYPAEEVALAPSAVVAPPTCEVTRNGDEENPLTCQRYSGVVEPIVMGPGRIRLVLDELPEGMSEPEWAAVVDEGNDEVPLWVVDFTPTGKRLAGTMICPEDSEPLAAAVGADNSFHLACSDYGETVYHVVLPAKRTTSKLLGSFTIHYDEEMEVDFSEMGPEGSGRAVLAVPDRGPAFLVYVAYSDMGDSTYSARVQPLARGARSFNLFPATKLSDIGEWELYQDAGRVFAVVRARSQSEGTYGLHKVQVSSTGSRLVGSFELASTASSQLPCHRLTTAAARGGLEIRSPNEFGDQQLSTVIKGGRGFPGPDSAPGNASVCGEPGQVYVRRDATEAKLRSEFGFSNSHHLTCQGEHCLLGFVTDEGLAILPLDL